MSTRLQVIVDEAELESYQRSAERDGVTLSEWVRQTLRRGQREGAAGDMSGKLAAIRRAVDHQFPTADIDQMLAEIDRGYAGDEPPA